MTATASETASTETISSTSTTAPVPKRITNAQTVCNEKNEKGKLCNGHLKQLRTAGEAAEIHLRGDDVLFKCQTCGTFYMGPPLGHVRDPQKQSRFVEAELTALLQAAGGTLPVIKKDARGVFIMEVPGHASAKPAAAKAPAAPAVANSPAPAATRPATAATAPAQKTAAPTAEANRQLNKRSTYAGVVDSGPVAGESFEQKVARLKAVAAGAKQRAEAGGAETAPAAAVAPESPVVASVLESAMAPPPTEGETSGAAPAVASTPAPQVASAEHKPTGQADRTLMLRSTYCGVMDTGPVAGETFEQKVERLRALAAAAKQRADGG